MKLKELRAERDWTQNELARRSGVDRGYLASIETDKVDNPAVPIFLKLSRAFNIRPEELYQAADYIKDSMFYRHKETPEEILERLRLANPVSIPVYTSYPREFSKWYEMIDYIYLDRREAKRSLEAYLIYGGKPLMEPEIKDEDVIIVDREGEINNGSTIVCLYNDMLQLGKLRKIADELWLENNDGRIKFDECQVAAPVIGVIRKLK